MTATRIYARWANHINLSLPGIPLPIPAHAYDAPIPIPSRPKQGERVRIIALSPMAYRTMYTPVGANRYNVYDPYVEGVVEGVRLVGPTRVAFAVKNDRCESGVGWVVVTAPFDVNSMDPPPEEERPQEWLKKCLAVERSSVELQQDAVVVDELGDEPSPPVTLQYPDPRVQRRDRLLTDSCGCWRPASPAAEVPEPM